jgi:hypothetical protein
MGQAKRRGSFEDRKRQSIIRHEEEKRRAEEYRKLCPPQSSKRLPMLPLYMAMMMANSFPYYNMREPMSNRRKP